jgi:hypothetical protein
MRSKPPMTPLRIPLRIRPMFWPALAIVLLAIVQFSIPKLFAQHGHAAKSTAPLSVHIGDSIVPLTGPWKFQVGDSPIDPMTHQPIWAESGFDDSKWESVDLTAAGSNDPISGLPGYIPGWTRKGHPGYSGYAWYRITVDVNAHPGTSLSLAGPSDIDDAYQFFENGTLTGSFGDFSQTPPGVLYAQPRMFSISDPAADKSVPISPGTDEMYLPAQSNRRTFAFRVWMNAYTLTVGDDAGGMHTAPRLGETNAIAAQNLVDWDHLARTYFTQPVQFLVFGTLAILVLSLVLFDRTDRVYWWIALLFCLLSLQGLENCFSTWSPWVDGKIDVDFTIVFGNSVSYGIWVMIWRAWFQQRRPRFIPYVVAALVAILMVATMFSRHNLSFEVSAALASNFQVVTLVVRLLLAALMLFTVVRGIRSLGTEGWLALPAVLLAIISEFYGELQSSGILPFWFPFGVRIRITEITNALLVVVLGILLLRRLLRSLERQRLLALDVKQAQEVQEVLIPEEIPSIPGFEIHAIYKPAGQVGGDFFQILPTPNNGVLIVIGDVSGKGMPAAMTVSLLVGTVRTLAHYTQSPAEILSAMNYRMLGRTRGGFTTCMVLSVSSEGTIAAASAGHIPPYLNGEETAVETGLPLGLSANSKYQKVTAHLPAGYQLTLLTDGVPEARNEKGELYGFDRTAAIATQSAEAISQAAQAFGQDDDITVLTLKRIAEPVF